MVRSRFGTASAIEFGNCRLRALFGAMFIELNKLSKSTLGRCIENQEIVEICAHTEEGFTGSRCSAPDSQGETIIRHENLADLE